MRIIAVDTETTGFSTWKGHRPFLFQAYDGEKMFVTKTSQDFEDIMHDKTITKVFHNAKFDIMMLRSVGIEVQGEIHDTIIAKHLLDENSSDSLENCALLYLKEKKLADTVRKWLDENGYTKARQEAEDRAFYELVPDEIMIPYAEQDVKLTLQLWEIFEPMLKSQGLWEVYLEEVYLAIHTLPRIEMRGMPVDLDYFRNLRSKYEQEIAEIEQQIYTMTGKVFNIGSNKQLAEILIDMGISLPVSAKGNFQVNKDVLEEIESPITNLLNERSNKQKFMTTYCDGILKKQFEGVLHPGLNSIGATTGRFSSSWHSIPKRKKDDAIQRGFTVREGFTNYYIDYKQQEYRVFADYSGDQKLIEACNNDYDFHEFVKDLINQFITDHNFDIKLLTRDDAKTFNFGLLYGMGVNKLAKKLGISLGAAKALRDTYYRLFPSLKYQDIDGEWKGLFPDVDKAIRLRQDRSGYGFVHNRFGRRRRIESKISYTGLNAIVQGGCADYVKMVMNKLHRYFVENNLKSGMLFQIHDALVIEIADDEKHILNDIITIMEDSYKYFKVKLAVDVEYSITNWAEAQKYA